MRFSIPLTLVENPGRWESIIVGQVVLLSYYGFGFRSVGVYLVY